MPRPRKLTPGILAAALQGLEIQRDRIGSQIAEVQRMLGAGPKAPAAPAKAKSAPAPEAPKRKRRMSAAGRKAIIEATKKRWAEFRKQAAKPAVARKAARKKVAVKSPAKVTTKAVKKTTAKRPKAAVAAPEQATPTVAAGE